jgi:putative membrane protein
MGMEEVVRNLNSPLTKGAYVAGVTTFCTFLGCWAVLAHQETTSQTAHAAVSDSQFAKKTAQGGMAEVKLGQLAQAKGTSDSVKKFGQRMVEDHTKVGDELKRAAAQENITLPDDVSAKDKATYDSLSKLSGAAFDRAYARDMVKDHEEDVAEFNREAHGGKSAVIKNFATQTLPTLQDHLKEAKQVRQNVSASNPTSTKGNPSSHAGRK